MAFSVQYDFRVLDRFSGPIEKMNQALARQKQHMERTRASMRTMAQDLDRVGKSMANFRTAAGTAGAIIALKDIVGVTRSFEFALNKVEAVTGSTSDQMGQLRDQAKMLGATTQFSAVQAADAMTFLGMAGLKANDIISVMPGMLDLAAAGDLQLADAADIATNVLAMFGMKLTQIGHLSDVLAKAAANSNTNVYELAEAIKNAGSTAHLAGLSLEETTASLMLLANMGIKGGEAGTQLMNALRAITAMSPKASKALSKLGIDPKKLIDSEGKIKDFTGLVKQLAAKGATLGEMFKIFDIRGAKAMAVLKQSGDKALSSFTDMLVEADDTGKTMANTLMKGLPGAMKLFESAFEGVKLSMGDAIKGPLTGFLNITASIMGFIQQKAPWILKLATYFLTLIVVLGSLTVVIGVAISLFSAFVMLASFITAPMLTIAGAVAAVAGAFIYWTDTGHPVISIIRDIASIIGDALFAIGDMFGLFGEGTKTVDVLSWMLNKLGQAIHIMLIPLKASALIFRMILETVTSLLSLDFGKLGGIFGKFASGMGGLAGEGFGAVKDFIGVGSSSGDTAKEASQQRSNASASNNKVQATINLKAGKGTNVAVAEPDLNTGGNVAVAY